MGASDTKSALLDKLIGIQDIEAAKPVEEMDTDMISVCSGCIIALTEEELPSARALEQMQKRLLDRLFGRNANARKARKGIRRKLLIAAIVAILIFAISAAMTPMGDDEESILARWGYFVLHMKPGEKKDFGEYLTIYCEGPGEHFKTIRRFVQKTGYDGLVPTEWPEGYKLEEVYVFYSYTMGCTIVDFVTNDSATVCVTVKIGKETDDLETRERTERIGAYDCALSFAPGQCQCEFNYNGNGYTVNTKTYADTVRIVKSMKGS